MVVFAWGYNVAPKSDTITCPVIALDSSLAKKSKMLATSIGMQGGTPKFICLRICPIISGFNEAGSVVIVIGVIIVLGFTELQRIPVPVKRSAVCLVKPITAALLVT